MNEEFRNQYYQIEAQKYLQEKLGNSVWIQVSGHKKINKSEAGFWCGFVSKDYSRNCFDDFSWDIDMQSGFPGFEMNGNGTEYKAKSVDEGFEPLLYYREFYGAATDYVEVSQEFILLNNLRYDKKHNAYYAMYTSGETEEAIKYIDSCTIEINTRFLLNYAAAKQLDILIEYDIRTKLPGLLSDYDLKKFSEVKKTGQVIYSISGDEYRIPDTVFSRILGKKVIESDSVEKCGFWPYESQKQYEEFIIGTEKGQPILYTCNPERLDNYYGANPEAPHYLTPVFFSREVLQKYYSKPELYTIRDGHLDCQSLWGIEIDNHHKDLVSVYLGDLGRDLPESEQKHWKLYNVQTDEQLSAVSFGRDILNCFMDSNIIEHQFKRDYKQLNELWVKAYGWPLYLELKDGDMYTLNQIRRPLNESQMEFDQLVLMLCKLVIDSLNEKRISSELNAIDSDTKGISKLEQWLSEHEVAQYEEHIRFLRDLWELRSSGSGHRKGRQYKKVTERFGISEMNLPDAYDEILSKTDSYLKFMMNVAS